MDTTRRFQSDAARLRTQQPGRLADARLDYARNRAEDEAVEREQAEAARIEAERVAA